MQRPKEKGHKRQYNGQKKKDIKDKQWATAQYKQYKTPG